MEVADLGRIIQTDAGLVATRDALAPAGLTSLQAALQRYEYSLGGPSDIHVTDEAEDQVDDESQLDQTSLVYREGRLVTQTFAAVGEAKPDEQLIRSLISPILERERMEIVEINLTEEKWGWGVWFTLRVPIRRQSVGDALRRADAVREMIEAGYGQEFSAATAASVIRAGHPELLVGMFESDWFDAKRALYRLDHEVGQYELAKDVASFANSGGGLILIGAKTKRRPQGDEISSANGCVLADAVVKELRSVVERRVHPRVEGLRIEQVPLSASDRGVALIEIPNQADGQKPFLVVGTRTEDRVSELGFTYAVRDGEHTKAPRIEVIHQLIRAGQAVLSGDGYSPGIGALKADIERLEAANWESWLSDIVFSAVRNGFEVKRDGDQVVFRKGKGEQLIVQATVSAPPADLLQRQRLLEGLGELGLPVRQASRGFLQPG